MIIVPDTQDLPNFQTPLIDRINQSVNINSGSLSLSMFPSECNHKWTWKCIHFTADHR